MDKYATCGNCGWKKTSKSSKKQINSHQLYKRDNIMEIYEFKKEHNLDILKYFIKSKKNTHYLCAKCNLQLSRVMGDSQPQNIYSCDTDTTHDMECFINTYYKSKTPKPSSSGHYFFFTL